MKGKYLGGIVLISLVMVLTAIFICGTVLADDGSNTTSGINIPEWIWAIVALAAKLYWDALKAKIGTIKAEVAALWKSKEDGVAWKLRGSLIAVGKVLLACAVSIWPMILSALKEFPTGTVVNLGIKMVKNRVTKAACKAMARKA